MAINLHILDKARIASGLLSFDEIIALSSHNTIYDPFSTLISKGISIGSGNVIYPSTCLLLEGDAVFKVGEKNIFYPGTSISATYGDIIIGDGNQFGEGGFVAKTNRAKSHITIGCHGRYLGGVSVFGESQLGNGSQILGAITVDNCYLEAGGSFNDKRPDQRAGVLKGQGYARNLFVPKGHVIFAQGDFEAASMKSQLFYHPNTA